MNLLKDVTCSNRLKSKGGSTVHKRSILSHILEYVTTNITVITMIDGTPRSAQQVVDGVWISDIVPLLIFHGMYWGRVIVGDVPIGVFVISTVEHLVLALLTSVLPLFIIELSMKLQEMFLKCKQGDKCTRSIFKLRVQKMGEVRSETEILSKVLTLYSQPSLMHKS